MLICNIILFGDSRYIFKITCCNLVVCIFKIYVLLFIHLKVDELIIEIKLIYFKTFRFVILTVIIKQAQTYI